MTWARTIRQIVLERSFAAGVGHIGSSLCVAEILAVLYGEVLQAKDPDDADRDRMILSKGHAALALYAALQLRGWIRSTDLDGFFCNGSLFGVHPEATIPGVDFCTGSLGMGLGFGAGAALAARLQGSRRRAFVLISDAECNEGSLWEAVHAAAHHRLENLTAILDDNGQQAFGYTRDVLDLGSLADRFEAAGWQTIRADGHDTAALAAAFAAPADGRPRLIAAKTLFGKGVSYMEGRIDWHYLPMSEAQYRQALIEVGAS